MIHAIRTIRQPTPRGFTLIEILVVMGLIAFMASISYVVIGNFTETAQEAATKATLLKADEILRQRIEGFNRFVDQSQEVRSIVNNNFEVLRYQYGRSPSKATLNILFRKRLFQWHFPQSYADVASAVGPTDPRNGRSVVGSSSSIPFNPNPPQFTGIAIPDVSVMPTVRMLNYFYQINSNGQWEPKNIISVADSSELLYFILTQSTFVGAPVVDTDRFKTSELRDIDGDGLAELYDAWEQPLRFYRWPTRLFRPNGIGSDERPGEAGTDDDGNGLVDDEIEVGFGGTDDGSVDLGRQIGAGVLIPGLPQKPVTASVPDSMTQDPDDPLGILLYEAARLQLENSRFNYWLLVSERALHTPATYHVPIIVSAGPDLELGIEEATPLVYDNNDSDFQVWQLNGRLAQPTGNLDVLYDNLINRNARPRTR